MKHPLDLSVFTMQEEEKQWASEKIPILCATLSLPQWPKTPRSRIARRLNRYYGQYQHSFLSYCAHYLYPQALAEFQYAQENSLPLPCAQAALRCTVAYNQDQLLSLYLDCTEWIGTAQALTLRRADTWELVHGTQLSAQDCFPKKSNIRQQCLKTALSQCRQQAKEGRSIYAPHLAFRLRRHLNLRNFYLTAEGFHFFYQPYTIAPAFEGCPTFLLPFSEEDGPKLPSIL